VLGRSANVANFVMPLAGGLIFGELQRVDLNVEEANSYAPKVIDFNNGLGLERQLRDFFYNGRERTIVIVRTYVGGSSLKPNQLRLQRTLERYITRHRAAIECFMLWPRLSFDADVPYGRTYCDLFTSSHPDFREALSELDEIISSDDWRGEIKRSIQNRSRRKHAYQH